MIGARQAKPPERAPEPARRVPPPPAPHDLLALQRGAGNHAVTRMLARMKLATDPLREAKEGDKDVIDTDTLSLDELKKLIERAANEGNMDLFERLLAEEAAREEPADDVPKEEKKKRAKRGPGGMVTMKTVFGDTHELHGLPGLIGSPKAFQASLDADLGSDGIDPTSPVTALLYWRPANTSDHVELGAYVGGAYTKLHLTTGGYHLIRNATKPTLKKEGKATAAEGKKEVVYDACESIPLQGVSARLFYATFLDVAKDLRDFNMDTNDCRNFADRMERTLKRYAPQGDEEKDSGDADDFM